MSKELDALIERFSALFSGYSKAHGRYDVQTTGEDGKRKGPAWTATGAITPAVWREHLEGTGPGLGIIMLRDDDTCFFGTIDHDDKTADHVELEKEVKRLKLPLVVVRSKSGGAHLYVFTKEPVPATLLQARMSEWVARLGMAASTEQFPKQSSRASDIDQGNWINIPYQNAAKSDRYAFKDGKAIGLQAFVDYAESKRVSLKDLQAPVFKVLQSDDPLYEAPPCLITLYQQGGFQEGSRNDGMMAVGVYLRKRFEDDWPTKLREYNATMCSRVLPEEEIKEIERSLAKKDYHYRCKQAPINNVCNRRACTSRQFGIGDTTQVANDFFGLTRYEYQPPDPPMWAFEIVGKRVLVDNDTMYSRDALNRAVMAQANCIPIKITPNRWLIQLNTMLGSADVVPMPDDAGPTGQLWERIQIFLEHGVPALVQDELVSGKILRRDGLAFFRGSDLFDYLESRRIKFKSEQAVWQVLRQNGARTTAMKISNKTMNIWQVPFKANAEIPFHGERMPMPTGEEF